ncbi:MAG TPA: response regulator [Terriglobales bacterium]|nr:response regulator [Terriglobales bacterium]
MATILIVDDHPDSRWVLADLTRREGHHVIEARNGVEALSIYRRHRPDVVLLDLFMPEQSGFETIVALREEFPRSRIIVVSAGWRVGAHDGLRRARELGADLTIRKPIDLFVVRKAVAELLAV